MGERWLHCDYKNTLVQAMNSDDVWKYINRSPRRRRLDEEEEEDNGRRVRKEEPPTPSRRLREMRGVWGGSRLHGPSAGTPRTISAFLNRKCLEINFSYPDFQRNSFASESFDSSLTPNQLISIE